MSAQFKAVVRRNLEANKLLLGPIRKDKVRGTTRVLVVLLAGILPSCSPRDFLSRRLAADLIAASDAFRATQNFQMRTGVLSSKDYLSPDYLVLQRRGWISGTKASCPSDVAPPCLDVALTPAGVDAFQNLIIPAQAERQQFILPGAKRQLIAITGITKQGSTADIEFTWRWISLNEVGAALYPADRHYRSIVAFRNYDDGWRVITTSSYQSQPLNEALRDAESVP